MFALQREYILELKHIEMCPANICSPFTTLDELYQCLSKPPTWVNSIIKLKSRSDYVIKNTEEDCHTEDYSFVPKKRLYKNLAPKTLVCHDMKNGYLEDKYLGKVNVGNGYTFYRWSQIDIFIYFSHHLITIPPLSWINVAHNQGVPILGTFITEWNAGKAVCDFILKDMQTVERVANALIDICILFKLDGWLLNIENKVENTQNLKHFIKYLTDNLHRKQQESYIIWYDSVINSGDLQWQNELNEKNRCFFDVCDGIFLNYTWKKENLEKTVKQAKHRINDVYVGLDVFGRGCFGGGKFNSYLAAKAVREHNLSLAIFAQGWTHESLSTEPKETFLERFHVKDNNWWNTLWPYLYSHPIKYAFKTNFRIGVNNHFYNLESQNLQLTNFLSCYKISEVEELGLLTEKCICLKDNIESDRKICLISNKTLPEFKNYVHHLFSTQIFLHGNYIIYCYTKSTQACDYKLILLIQNQYKHITKMVCHSNPPSDGEYQDDVIEIVPMFDSSFLRDENVPKDWQLR
ncbi:endo beta n-acetylglucosaminidase [Holotrichia oblita]|uniref:Endo beta n-acetylglucosaminidase n=1 Tax=Holotrichia oblita TaxID=644536 RepID=A0ACB9SLN6_HOLOL|nr:endo beta n-acetylglucosaminidase [Holotrichia oblita]